MKIFARNIIGYFFVLFTIVSYSSCNKFKGSQEIPAYIKVDSFQLTTNYQVEGAATQNITDVWVYVDDNIQGCYELPATIPILENGTHKLALYPGIKLNGISSTRIVYPFYQPYIIDSYNFTIGSVDVVQPTTRYYSVDETSFKFWIEDFETSSGNFTPTTGSDTTITRTAAGDPNAWSSDDSKYSGHVWIGDTLNYFFISSEKFTEIPKSGGYTIMELDYKCDKEFEVGLFVEDDGSLITVELLYVNPTSTWKKIYINFSPTLTDYNSSSYYKFFITGSVEESSTADFYFDNIKLVYRD